MTCIFCEIAQGRTSTPLIYQDSQVVAFKDISPQAPHHLLIIPKQHIATLNELNANHQQVMGQLILVATQLAKQLGFADSGYRLVANCNEDGGQMVFHIHLHLLGGHRLASPMG